MATFRSALSGSVNFPLYEGVMLEELPVGADVQLCRVRAQMLISSVYKKNRIPGLYISEQKNPVIILNANACFGRCLRLLCYLIFE